MRFLRSTYFLRSVTSILLAGIFLLHSAGQLSIPFLDKVENLIYDIRLSNTTPNTVDDNIVILDIDEKSLANEGRWPWSRDKLSYLVDILFDYYELRLLGFDIVFAEPDTSSGLNLLEELEKGELAQNPEYLKVISRLKGNLDFDQLFANSLLNRPVVLGYYFNSENQNINPSSALPFAAFKSEQHPNLSLFKASGVGANLAILQEAAHYGGYFNNESVDSDGSYRRLPLLMNYNDHIYETLSLAMYRRLLGHPDLSFSFGDDYGDTPRLESIDIESLSIPVNQNAVALVPYRGRQGSFKYISITDVLNGEIPVEALKNKIAIMGATAAGILDLRTTPVQHIYPGVEVHANLLSAMLEQRFKSKPSYSQGINALLIILITVLMIIVYPKLGSISSAAFFIFLAGLLTLSNLVAWTDLNLDLNLASPLLLIVTLFLIQLFFGYFLETKKRNKLGQIFGQYIPAELVAEMSQTEHDYSLVAQSKELTVLFSDVRGFTTISESMEPEALSELINEILTPVTKAIHHNKGTIDKYIGDAIMAFWGAPIDDPRHAHNAVKAALEFMPILDVINLEFAQKDWPKIDMGIGINTGNMNVGNMGSEFRMAYTVMGDAVNLGSRLEGLTKHYGVNIIVSEATKTQAPSFLYCELDRVQVKGKNEPITIFEPICENALITPELEEKISQFEQALQHYYQQNWSTALTLLEALCATYPSQMLYSIYLDRIKHYMTSPPSKDWDGVYAHQTK